MRLKHCSRESVIRGEQGAPAALVRGCSLRMRRWQLTRRCQWMKGHVTLGEGGGRGAGAARQQRVAADGAMREGAGVEKIGLRA